MGNHPNRTMRTALNTKHIYNNHCLNGGTLISKSVYETEDQALMKRYLRETRAVTPYTREVTVTKKENTHE